MGPTAVMPVDSQIDIGYGECEGECIDDSDCEGDLICYDIVDVDESIHGCSTSLSRSNDLEAICVQVVPTGEEPTPAITGGEPTPAPSSLTEPTADSPQSLASQTIISYTTTLFVVAVAALVV